MVWALFNKEKVPAADVAMSFDQKIYASRHMMFLSSR
jgi:hypothetical protein